MKKDWLRHAELDNKKLIRLRDFDWAGAEGRVPKGTQWSEQVAKYHLAPTDISDILRDAFNHSSASSNKPLWTADNEHEEASSAQSTANCIVPHIWRAALDLFFRASRSEEKSVKLQQITSVTRLVAFALMRVSTVAGEVVGEVVRASTASTIHVGITRITSAYRHYAAVVKPGGRDPRMSHVLGVGQCRTCPARGVERLHNILVSPLRNSKLRKRGRVDYATYSSGRYRWMLGNL